MRHLLFAALSFGVISEGVAAQEKDAPKKAAEAVKTPDEQLKELEGKFKKAHEKYGKEIRAAKTPAEQNKIFEEKYPKPEKFAGEFLDLAKKHVGTDTAAGALAWVVENAGDTPAAKEALTTLGKDHLKSEKIARVCEPLAEMGTPEAEALLGRVLAENPTIPAQAAACFGLAQLFGGRAELAQQLAAGGEEAKELEQMLGAEKVASLKGGPASFEKKAEEYYDKVVAKYSDVKRQKSTFGDAARSELFVIRNLTIGKTAPETESEDLDGKKVKLSELRGRVVVLDIWATWCGPCKAMIPHERKLVERLKDKPFTFVSISFDESKDDLKSFIKETPMPWTHWFNGAEGPIGKAWNIKYFPTIYVLDAKGVIRFKGVRGEAMDKAVDTLLAEVK